MTLFIKVANGQAVGHPILENNFRQAFPDIDTNNLPPEFAVFERVEQPVLGAYEVYDGHTYEKDGAIFKDVHHVREMTAEEKTAKQNRAKSSWANGPAYASWVFNEETCVFDPPIPHPEGSEPFMWDEATTKWVKVT